MLACSRPPQPAETGKGAPGSCKFEILFHNVTHDSPTGSIESEIDDQGDRRKHSNHSQHARPPPRVSRMRDPAILDLTSCDSTAATIFSRADPRSRLRGDWCLVAWRQRHHGTLQRPFERTSDRLDALPDLKKIRLHHARTMWVEALAEAGWDGGPASGCAGVARQGVFPHNRWGGGGMLPDDHEPAG